MAASSWKALMAATITIATKAIVSSSDKFGGRSVGWVFEVMAFTITIL